tara:strand:- start:5456 stop:5821 length:366 start_codon:yes stop_codon:yes gene_type:complete
MKKIASLLIIVLITVSCNETKKEDSTTTANKKEVAANYKSIEVEIEGMTCEIGCARLIQSKLSKVDGITYTKVDFESKKGIFTFDSNKLTKEDIALNVSKIADGNLYAISKIKELDSIIKK